MSPQEIFRLLEEIVNDLAKLNNCPLRQLRESDTPFDGKSGLDSLNALEAEAELANRLKLPAQAHQVSILHDPKVSIGEAARQIAAAIGTP